MKTLLVIAIAASLAACAEAPVQQRYAQPADPGQWRVVSVTPVEPGTGSAGSLPIFTTRFSPSTWTTCGLIARA